MTKKYELLKDDTITVEGRTLYRIRALVDLDLFIREGALGGYIEHEGNLSHEGHAWVTRHALVYNGARVKGDALVSRDAVVSNHAVCAGNAHVTDNVQIKGHVLVDGHAHLSGNAEIHSLNDFIVFKNSWSSGRWFTYTKSNKMWRVGCFYGTGEELIKKAYSDSEVSGKHYELYVNLVRDMEKLENG